MKFDLWYPELKVDRYKVKIDKENVVVSYMRRKDKLKVVVPIYCEQDYDGIPTVEPEVKCCVMDEDARILFTESSKHEDLFWSAYFSECTIVIPEFSKCLKEAGHFPTLDNLLDRYFVLRLSVSYPVTDLYYKIRKKDVELMRNMAYRESLNPMNVLPNAGMGNVTYVSGTIPGTMRVPIVYLPDGTMVYGYVTDRGMVSGYTSDRGMVTGYAADNHGNGYVPANNKSGPDFHINHNSKNKEKKCKLNNICEYVGGCYYIDECPYKSPYKS